MEKACFCCRVGAGALMPDARRRYGLPIGGVLATENAVIPYAVGVTSRCRMKMTVLDIPVHDLERKQDRLTRAIEAETRFGVERVQGAPRARCAGCGLVRQPNHETEQGPRLVPTRDQREWKFILSNSVCSRHTRRSTILGRETYVALLSHSGSRGTGCGGVRSLQQDCFRAVSDLPKELKRLAWFVAGFAGWSGILERDGVDGPITRRRTTVHSPAHRRRLSRAGAARSGDHHNFAWKERHVIGGVEREVIVHRKGANAGGQGCWASFPLDGVAGICRERQSNAESWNSASHGAGRTMSRKREREVQLERCEPSLRDARR